MAKKVIQDSSETFEQFSSVAPDLKRKNERSLVDELYKKNWAVDAMDNYEKAVGITPPSGKVEEVIYDNHLFNPTYDADKKLLNELMNSPKYKIIYMKDNWSPDGEYRVFVVYSKSGEPKKEIK